MAKDKHGDTQPITKIGSTSQTQLHVLTWKAREVIQHHDGLHLMIDIDDSSPPDILRMRGLLSLCGIRPIELRYRRSSSMEGWHVIVELPFILPDMEILCLQAILGSDSKREAFNYLRFSDENMPETWRKWSNVLFK